MTWTLMSLGHQMTWTLMSLGHQMTSGANEIILVNWSSRGSRDFTLLDGAVRHGFLHRHDDRVAERGVALVGAAHHTDALHLLGAGVVGYVKHGARLDHGLGRRAAEDLADPPALLLRERTRLFDQHAIAHPAFVALVVRL